MKITFDEAAEMVIDAFDLWECEYSYIDDWSKEHEARDLAIEALMRMKREKIENDDYSD